MVVESTCIIVASCSWVSLFFFLNDLISSGVMKTCFHLYLTTQQSPRTSHCCTNMPSIQHLAAHCLSLPLKLKFHQSSYHQLSTGSSAWQSQQVISRLQRRALLPLSSFVPDSGKLAEHELSDSPSDCMFSSFLEMSDIQNIRLCGVFRCTSPTIRFFASHSAESQYRIAVAAMVLMVERGLNKFSKSAKRSNVEG